MMESVHIQDNRRVFRDVHSIVNEIVCGVVRGGHPKWRVETEYLIVWHS